MTDGFPVNGITQYFGVFIAKAEDGSSAFIFLQPYWMPKILGYRKNLIRISAIDFYIPFSFFLYAFFGFHNSMPTFYFFKEYSDYIILCLKEV